MSIDTPATILIIGAGPVGLEAALYGRFLGYDVQVLERSLIASALRDDRSEEHRQPVGQCCSPLGLRALMAQDPQFQPPDLDTLWTPQELAENYLIPLAKSDLLDGRIAENMDVVDVRRGESSLDDRVADATEEDEVPGEEAIEDVRPPLLVQALADDGSEKTLQADIVIDASGVGGGPEFLFIAALMFSLSPGTDRPIPCGDKAVHGSAASLVLEEPNFYILGSKSRGREGGFRMADGLRQIRDLFKLIGGRETLDLYQDIGRFRVSPDESGNG